MAGGVHFAAEHICHTEEAVDARFAGPENSTDSIVILELFDFNRVVGVDHHDHPGGVSLGKFNHSLFIGAQSQRAFISVGFVILFAFFDQVLHVRMIICRFRAVPGENHQSDGSVCRREHIISVDISRSFTDIIHGSIFKHLAEGRIDGMPACAAVCLGHIIGVIQGDHLLIELESLFLQRGYDPVFNLAGSCIGKDG